MTKLEKLLILKAIILWIISLVALVEFSIIYHHNMHDPMVNVWGYIVMITWFLAFISLMTILMRKFN